MLLNCGVREDSWESLGQQGDPTSQKEISPEYLLEGVMLKLKLHYLGHLMWRSDLLEKTLLLEKIEGKREGDDREQDGWRASPTRWTWVSASSGRCWRTGNPGVLQSMGSQRVAYDWVTEQQLLYYVVQIVPALVVFPASILESAILPGCSSSFCYRAVLETKIWVLGVLTMYIFKNLNVF